MVTPGSRWAAWIDSQQIDTHPCTFSSPFHSLTWRKKRQEERKCGGNVGTSPGKWREGQHLEHPAGTRTLWPGPPLLNFSRLSSSLPLLFTALSTSSRYVEPADGEREAPSARAQRPSRSLGEHAQGQEFPPNEAQP